MKYLAQMFRGLLAVLSVFVAILLLTPMGWIALTMIALFFLASK